MTISASSTFNVADQTPTTIAASAPILPAATYGAGGLGRLVHPTLGAYDYSLAPAVVKGFDSDPLYGPIWSHAQTLAGAVDAVWPGFLRDALVVESWGAGMLVGQAVPIALFRMLWAMFANPPADPAANPVLWSPNYATSASYKVAIVDVRVGGSEGVTLDAYARSRGQVLGPLELELRILGDV